MERSFYWANINIDPNNLEKVECIIHLMQNMGIDSVILNQPIPWQIQLIRSHHIKVYVDFPCFAGQKIWEQYPESRPIDSDGSPIASEDWYYGVNPSIERVRVDLLRKFEKLILTDSIDGVWLDFIRWPCHWEVHNPKLIQMSFDEYTMHRFFNETGLAKPLYNLKEEILSKHFQVWVQWKSSIITSWVQSACEIRNKVAPCVTLGLFGVPWLKAEYDGAIQSIIGQDYAALSKYVDVFSPMTYHLMCNRPVSWIGDSIREISFTTGKRIVPVIQCMDNPYTLKVDEYASAMRSVLESKHADGVMIFELELLLQSNKLDITNMMLRNG